MNQRKSFTQLSHLAQFSQCTHQFPHQFSLSCQDKEFDSELIQIYNEAYLSYINDINPIIFMNVMLNKVIKLTKSTSGFISSITELHNKKYMTLDAFDNTMITCNE